MEGFLKNLLSGEMDYMARLSRHFNGPQSQATKGGIFSTRIFVFNKHLYNTYYVPDRQCSKHFTVLTHLIPTKVFLPLLQMRKLRQLNSHPANKWSGSLA